MGCVLILTPPVWWQKLPDLMYLRLAAPCFVAVLLRRFLLHITRAALLPVLPSDWLVYCRLFGRPGDVGTPPGRTRPQALRG